MRQLSVWAHQHKWAARFLLILFHGLLILLAIYWGGTLAAMGILIPEELMIVMSVTVFLIYIFCPARRKSPDNYRIRKLYESLSLVMGVLLLTFLCCNLSPGPEAYRVNEKIDKPNYAQFIVLKESVLDKAVIRAQKREARQEKRTFRKQLKAEIRAYLKANSQQNPISSGGAFVLIFLSILGGVGIMMLSAAFGCSISCNGNEALGVALMVFGFIGGLVLMISLINKISRRRKATKQAEDAIGT